MIPRIAVAANTPALARTASVEIIPSLKLSIAIILADERSAARQSGEDCTNRTGKLKERDQPHLTDDVECQPDHKIMITPTAPPLAGAYLAAGHPLADSFRNRSHPP